MCLYIHLTYHLKAHRLSNNMIKNYLHRGKVNKVEMKFDFLKRVLVGLACMVPHYLKIIPFRYF